MWVVHVVQIVCLAPLTCHDECGAGDGGVCELCTCLARGDLGGEEGEWTRGFGFGFNNLVGTGGVLDVCLCLGCGDVGG